MGADQHITDPDDRADLAALAAELYAQYGSLRKVREHLAAHETTRRVCGEVRHFSTDTIRTWLDEARTAERYLDLVDTARRRADSDTRLALLGAMLWDRYRIDRPQDWDTMIKLVDQLRKLERDRMDLHGLKAPIKVQNVGPENAGIIPTDMVAAVAALERRARARQQELLDDERPGATVVPVVPPRPRGTRRRPPPDNRRSS